MIANTAMYIPVSTLESVQVNLGALTAVAAIFVVCGNEVSAMLLCPLAQSQSMLYTI